MLRTNMDEMNVETVDLSDEVRHRVEPRLDLSPVVFRAPVARQLLDGRERHALREIRDGFALGQACRKNSPAKIREVRLGKVAAEGTNGGSITDRRVDECTHDWLLSVGVATLVDLVLRRAGCRRRRDRSRIPSKW